MSLLLILGIVAYVAVALWMARDIAGSIYFRKPDEWGKWKPGKIGTAIFVGLWWGALWPVVLAIVGVCIAHDKLVERREAQPVDERSAKAEKLFGSRERFE